MANVAGKVFRVVGPVVEIEAASNLRMLDMVAVGEQRLIGEIVHLKDEYAYVQVYEDTTSVKAGDLVYTEGYPLYVELGPGLLGNIYDGIQRPLEVIKDRQGAYISRGVGVSPLDMQKKWHFRPLCSAGSSVLPGAVLGEVQETPLISHKILIPPDVSGTIKWVSSEGDYTVADPVACISGNGADTDIRMAQKWPVRKPRPIKSKLSLGEPLITGQRVIDTLFPIAKGGCVAVPGGFGTGKTVIQHQLAKWSDANIVIYVGCGERGNEMTDVLLNFPKLIDPRTQRPLSERTIFIANTSNMPVAAREASIYTGITLAEYYRDMGYNVALMADSTSRWAEALRELSGRLEEMPLEEGFPAYLPSRLAEFYERAGRVTTLNDQTGSISIIAAVSPPGGDFSEPVTSHTKRFVRCLWALDRDLANSRHYPSISWIDSYSEYIDEIKDWWHANIDKEWLSLRLAIMELLQKEQRLQQVVKLVGPDVLPVAQRLVLEVCVLFKNGFLQQVSYDAVDTFSSARKQFLMLKTIIAFYHKADELVKKGISIAELRALPVYEEISRMKQTYTENDLEALEKLSRRVIDALTEIEL
ncbi:MAG: V-type ATP synthase subunit A [Candidatus Omnitrophica bacterium]|nr:V-type ATP synthase subunit A [Candidatus Omnitrophota bacterium]MDD5775141.1 V-type ATP synthase subunit A [Candidatus Omnitrophota bacterium]HNQ50962.1 V-type ATP synthase subunit A [Candidatus Omnitrophota bacterium]HQO37816.1 V-type ATP synthase subunit A [Candidatus Omnitrophota bacterium]HQQ05627.1 V-type ATP synthase subunit A [Candidatus Omnitrophota bacterium]